MEFFRQEFDRFQEMVYTQVVKLGIYIFLYVFHEIGGHWRDCLFSFSEKFFRPFPVPREHALGLTAIYTRLVEFR